MPVALTIAGSDSSSGAGIQADLKTFAAHEVYGVNAVTAIVAEVPGEVRQYQVSDPTLLAHQLNSVASSFPIVAAKTGMLATAAHVDVVVAFFRNNPDIALVVDPVIRATAGDIPLLDDEGVEILKNELLPLANLVTPNIPEAEFLLGKKLKTPDDFQSAGDEIFARFFCDSLIKGGHACSASSRKITDYIWLEGEDPRAMSRPRLAVPDLHGTGCTLSAAVAANLAKGLSHFAAIRDASVYLFHAMENHYEWEEPTPIAALNHFPNGPTLPKE